MQALFKVYWTFVRICTAAIGAGAVGQFEWIVPSLPPAKRGAGEATIAQGAALGGPAGYSPVYVVASLFLVEGPYVESEMFLGQVTERNNNDGGEYFGDSGEKMKLFNEHFDEDIIEPNTNYYQQKITEQLDFSPQVRVCKHNGAHQEESGRKTHTKGNQKCRCVGLESQETQVKNLFVKNVIKAYKEYKYIKDGIGSPTGSIPECQLRHESSEGWVKKINKSNNSSGQHFNLNNKGTKVIKRIVLFSLNPLWYCLI